MERIQENWKKVVSVVIGATLIPFLVAELRLPYIYKLVPWVERTFSDRRYIYDLLNLAFGIFCSVVLFLIYYLLRFKYRVFSVGILAGAIATTVLTIIFTLIMPLLKMFIAHS